MVYYDPRNDIVFRKIFGEHKNLCMSLLNSLLPLEEGAEIDWIEYLTEDALPDLPTQKNSVVDVRCKDKKGRQFIVEMQMYWTEAFFSRTLLNTAKTYASQTARGMKFKDLQPVYALCLLDENIPDTNDYEDEYMHTYTIRHTEHNELTMPGMTFVYIELQKYNSKNRAFRLMRDLWLGFLTKVAGKKKVNEIPMELQENDIIMEAVGYLTESSYTEKEKQYYEKYWDAVSCHRTLIDGKYEEGMKKGIKEGIEKGREEAMAEARSALVESARTLRRNGVSDEVIKASLGLTEEEMREL